MGEQTCSRPGHSPTGQMLTPVPTSCSPVAGVLAGT
jgi:hypothetical protein